MKKLQCILLLILIVFMAIPCMAADYEFSYSYEIPKDSIGFSSTNECTGHSYFEQFSVNQNQWVAVYYRYSKSNEKNTGAFSKVYIDLYNAEGSLEKEISFDSSQEIAIELTENAVLIFFQTHVMAYTWEDDAICGYQIAGYDSIRGDIFSELRKTEVTVGEWTYQSKRELHGYTTLTRENGSSKQTLIALPGTGFTTQRAVLTPLLIGAAAIAIAVVIAHIRSANRKRNPKG